MEFRPLPNGTVAAKFQHMDLGGPLPTAAGLCQEIPNVRPGGCRSLSLLD